MTVGGHFAVNSLNNLRRALAHLMSSEAGFRRTWAITSRMIFLSFITVGSMGLILVATLYLLFKYSMSREHCVNYYSGEGMDEKGEERREKGEDAVLKGLSYGYCVMKP